MAGSNPPERGQTWPVRLWNRVAPASQSLDPARLIARARSRTGLHDFGPPDVAAALTRLCQALNRTGNLSPMGATSTRALLHNLLVQRLYVQAHRGETETVVAPVIIAAPPRTGTTFLANLLACVPELRALRHWEASYPVQLPGRSGRAWTSSAWSRRAVAMTELLGQRSLMPELSRIHRFRLEGPEECTWLLMASLRSDAFSLVFDIPDYEEWLEQHDGAAALTFHRRTLSILGTGGRRWLLKSPFHLGREHLLAEQYPRAMFLRTTRDPVSVVASFCSMAETYRSLSSARVDRNALGREVLRFVARDWVKARQNEALLPAEALFKIPLKEFRVDPLGMVRRIAKRAGLTVGAREEARMAPIIRAREKRQFHPHTYALSDYGIDEEAVRVAMGS